MRVRNALEIYVHDRKSDEMVLSHIQPPSPLLVDQCSGRLPMRSILWKTMFGRLRLFRKLFYRWQRMSEGQRKIGPGPGGRSALLPSRALYILFASFELCCSPVLQGHVALGLKSSTPPLHCPGLCIT